MKEPESAQRTQRTLGLWGLVALGTTTNFAVIGVIFITLYPTDSNQTSDAITALSSIAAAGIGALAGWLARGHLGSWETKAVDTTDPGDTLKAQARAGQD